MKNDEDDLEIEVEDLRGAQVVRSHHEEISHEAMTCTERLRSLTILWSPSRSEVQFHKKAESGLNTSPSLLLIISGLSKACFWHCISMSVSSTMLWIYWRRKRKDKHERGIKCPYSTRTRCTFSTVQCCDKNFAIFIAQIILIWIPFSTRAVYKTVRIRSETCLQCSPSSPSPTPSLRSQSAKVDWASI